MTLPPVEDPAIRLEQLAAPLRLLLSPVVPDTPRWCDDLLRMMGSAFRADGAALLIWQDGTPTAHVYGVGLDVVDQYVRHYRQFDLGMVRRDELQLSAWHRRMLWDPHVLDRSTYYNEFARPNDLQDSLGVSLDFANPPANVRLSLLYGRRPLDTTAAERYVRELAFLLPAFRTGIGLHLRLSPWARALPDLLDKVGQGLMLFSPAGRELHRNGAMRRALDQDPGRDQLLAEVAQVAEAVAATQRTGREASVGPSARPPDSWRRVVASSGAQYCLRGCRVGPLGGMGPAILVSVDRYMPQPPSPERLRAAFGLTAREAQVACLLAQRLTNNEIALTLRISCHTARHHTESVLLKLGVKSRAALGQVLARVEEHLEAPSLLSTARMHRRRAPRARPHSEAT